jgi:hypothetical protein
MEAPTVLREVDGDINSRVESQETVDVIHAAWAQVPFRYIILKRTDYEYHWPENVIQRSKERATEYPTEEVQR